MPARATSRSGPPRNDRYGPDRNVLIHDVKYRGPTTVSSRNQYANISRTCQRDSRGPIAFQRCVSKRSRASAADRWWRSSEDWDGNAYRAVCTIHYREVVYVLHVFEKKSKSGKATPKTDLDLIKRRLKLAEQEYQRWRGNEAKR